MALSSETFNPTDSEVEKRADNDLDVDISPEMKVNMLEIRVLELLSENKVDEAVEFVGVSHDIEKVFLSEEILDALLTKIDPVTQVGSHDEQSVLMANWALLWYFSARIDDNS